ncbi:MAG: alpha/beta hydrolase [Pyrinomonadaceae bacterium]|nr:alpha/beta hydrolase [Pyrinomonadaceae bacterium]
MSRPRRTRKKILKTLLPALLLAAAALVGAFAWLIYGVAHPPQRAYLVTPEKFKQMSPRGVGATEERWANRDGTEARGWLLRGGEGSPGVVLLHAYAADRSWLLNLAVKLNETTNFTVLCPDARGHGENPPVGWTSLGAAEAEDALAAISFLRSLRTTQNRPLANSTVGLYGVEMGAYAALSAAGSGKYVRALALDSIPVAPDALLRSGVRNKIGLDNALVQGLARGAAQIYYLGRYRNTPSCQLAASITDRRVLLLTGEAAGELRSSTTALASCFPSTTSVELQNALPLTGYNFTSATSEQGEIYDRRIIEFFDAALR